MITSKFDLMSSNGIDVKVGQVVLYSDGYIASKCIIRKTNWAGQGLSHRLSSIHMEVVMSRGYEVGHIFKHCRNPIRLWVLDESAEDAVEQMITQPFRWQK